MDRDSKIESEIYFCLKNIKALINASSQAECFELAGMPESCYEVAALLRVGEEQINKATGLFEELEAAFNRFMNRLWQPEPGDMIPVELIVELTLLMAFPCNKTQWYQKVAQIGTALALHAHNYPELEAAIHIMVEVAQKTGGDVRYLNRDNGNDEVAYYGLLKAS